MTYVRFPLQQLFASSAVATAPNTLYWHDPSVSIVVKSKYEETITDISNTYSEQYAVLVPKPGVGSSLILRRRRPEKVG